MNCKLHLIYLFCMSSSLLQMKTFLFPLLNKSFAIHLLPVKPWREEMSSFWKKWALTCKLLFILNMHFTWKTWDAASSASTMSLVLFSSFLLVDSSSLSFDLELDWFVSSLSFLSHLLYNQNLQLLIDIIQISGWANILYDNQSWFYKCVTKHTVYLF